MKTSKQILEEIMAASKYYDKTDTAIIEYIDRLLILYYETIKIEILNKVCC